MKLALASGAQPRRSRRWCNGQVITASRPAQAIEPRKCCNKKARAMANSTGRIK